jgi:site-specific recombinase XerC
MTVEEWAERWLRTKSHLKPKTLAGYRSKLHAHLVPAFGGYQLRHVDRMAVEEWVADLHASGLGPSGIRQARQVLNSMLTLAVDAGYLPTNPVDGVRTPRQPEPQMLFLNADQVERLATSIHEPYGTLVRLLAYGGLRWGEAAALGVEDMRSATCFQQLDRLVTPHERYRWVTALLGNSSRFTTANRDARSRLSAVVATPRSSDGEYTRRFARRSHAAWLRHTPCRPVQTLNSKGTPAIAGVCQHARETRTCRLRQAPSS